MTATFADKSNPDEPAGFIDSNQVLLIRPNRLGP